MQILPPKITTIAFDLYGTLIDIVTDEQRKTTYDVLASWLSHQGLLVTSESLRQLYIEKCHDKMISVESDYPEIDIQEVFDAMIEVIGSDVAPEVRTAVMLNLPVLFRILTTSSISLSPGAEETLQQLSKDFRMGLISNAQKTFTAHELHYFKLPDFFHKIILSSEVGSSKPGRAIFEKFLLQMNVRPEETIFVGNNLFDDIYGAKNVGMKAVWFDRGAKGLFPPGVAEPVPDAIIGCLHELPEVLARLSER